jgi:hypothetical protein
VRIELTKRPERSDVALIPPVTSDPPTRFAAVATWVTSKEKLPVVPPAEEAAFQVLDELEGAATRCWKFVSANPDVMEVWKSVRRVLISVRAELVDVFVAFSVFIVVFGVALT